MFQSWNERLDILLVTYLAKLNASGHYQGSYYCLSYQIYPHDDLAWEQFKRDLGKNGLLIDYKYGLTQPLDYFDPEGKTWGTCYIRALHDGDAMM